MRDGSSFVDERIARAVEAGIITEAQAAAIRALPTRETDDADPSMAGGFVTALVGSARGFTAATIAYTLGALTVIGAMGWFLADRWNQLGGWGVLAVVAVYATLFLVTARVLRREGFVTAAGLAILLTVLLTPLAVVAVDELTGWLSPPRPLVRSCSYPDFIFWSCRGLEVVAELATVLAALVALRSTRFALLVVPIVAVAIRMLFHIGDGVYRQGLGGATTGWIWMIGASALAAAAYATDREQRGDEDFAFWFHCAAAAAAFGASITLLNAYEGYRHLLVPGAFVSFAAALTLRRRPWVLLGTLWFGWYLGWLASDVFRGSPAFPIVLAALGLAMIIATVWVQRNATRLVQRFGTVGGDGRPRFPGGVPLLLAPILVALLMFGDGLSRDRERYRERVWQNRLWSRRTARENAAREARIRAQAAGAATDQKTQPRETVP